jgi:hypothetical protein
MDLVYLVLGAALVAATVLLLRLCANLAPKKPR